MMRLPPTGVQDDPSAVDRQAELEHRVSELESALKKAADKEAAASEKARGRPAVNVTGVIDFDTAAFSQDANSQEQFPPGIDTLNGTGFRRARLGAYGEAFDVCFYRIEMDFAPFLAVRNATDDASAVLLDPALKSVFIGIKDLPVLGTVRVGHVKEPYSLDHLTRDRYGTFMERSLVDDGNLVPKRSPGVVFDNHTENERMTWHYGAFVPDVSESPPIFMGDHGGIAFTERCTLLPWYDEANKCYIHTGAAYSWRQNSTGALLYAARAESFFGPTVVSTAGQLTGANADVDHNQLLGAEFAFVKGPFCLQAEYYADFVDRRQHPDDAFSGYYAYLSYFLTGEQKPYDRKAGHFDRVVPLQNFGYSREDGRLVVNGWGAWLLAYRYSTLDLNDGLVQGGAVGAHTVGLNWYLNPNTRFVANYVIADVRRTRNNVSEGQMEVFEIRCHIDF